MDIILLSLTFKENTISSFLMYSDVASNGSSPVWRIKTEFSTSYI